MDSEGIPAGRITAGQKPKLLSGLPRKLRPSEGRSLPRDMKHRVRSGSRPRAFSTGSWCCGPRVHTPRPRNTNPSQLLGTHSVSLNSAPAHGGGGLGFLAHLELARPYRLQHGLISKWVCAAVARDAACGVPELHLHTTAELSPHPYPA